MSSEQSAQEHEPGDEPGSPAPQDGACAGRGACDLRIERHVKDDGRALILYRRAQR